MKKYNLLSTITFVGLCSVLTGCGVLIGENGGVSSNPAIKNEANVAVSSTAQNASNSIDVSSVKPTSVNSNDSSYVSVNSGMLAINRELIAVLDKEHVLDPVSNKTPSKGLKNPTQATTNKTSKGVPVIDKVKGGASKSIVNNNAHSIASTSGSSSKKTTSSSYYQGTTVAEQNKLDAQAWANTLAQTNYQDTHNPYLDGQYSTEHAGLKYKGTSSKDVITNVTTNTIPIKPGESFTWNTSTGNLTVGG